MTTETPLSELNRHADSPHAIPGNAVLGRNAEEAMQFARLLSGVTGKTEHAYGEMLCAAGGWDLERRVVIKIEVVYTEGKEPKDNPRFVITNTNQTPQWFYKKVYCQRGEIENWIMEPHTLKSTVLVAAGFGPISSSRCNRRRVRDNTGAAPSGRVNRLCAGVGLDVVRTLPETGRVGDGLRAAHRRASSEIVSVCGAFRQIALALGAAAG